MRLIEPHIVTDLARKMVFVGGPRQCGKTTLAKAILQSHTGQYFNWDAFDDQRAILGYKWSTDDALLVFAELHKFRNWKNWIKGLYDKHGDHHRILVTGSARLDIYRRGGDSLLGRYHYWRLHPFTLDEYVSEVSVAEAFTRLMTLGGFPEPFISGDPRFAKRWRRERTDRVLRDDLRDLEQIKQISSLSLLVNSLQQRGGGQVVVSNIANDLQVSPHSVKHWIELLERMYLVFTVTPYTTGVPRALQKAPKTYFFDNGDVEGEKGAVFENVVATHLLKWIHFLEDHDGDRYGLHYLRDKEGREVDFVVTRNRKVLALIEAKTHDQVPSTALCYYTERLRPSLSMQIVADDVRAFDTLGIRVVGYRVLAKNFLAGL